MVFKCTNLQIIAVLFECTSLHIIMVLIFDSIKMSLECGHDNYNLSHNQWQQRRVEIGVGLSSQYGSQCLDLPSPDCNITLGVLKINFHL